MSELVLMDEMTHSKIDVIQHICMPISRFNLRLFGPESGAEKKGNEIRFEEKYFDYDTAF